LAKLQALDESQIESIVSTAITDAVDFIDSEIVPERTLSQQYFDGKTRLGYEEGRSRVVATKCRDAVRAIKPSLMRVFLGTASPVEFIPKEPNDVQVAQQMTQYINYKLHRMNYFKLLNDAFQDALVKRLGILKVYYDDKKDTELYTYKNLDDAEFNYLVSDENVEVIEHSKVQTMVNDQASGQEIEKSYHNVKISRTKEYGDCAIDSVPPEEFFVDRNAKDIETAYVVGHRVNKTVGDLVAMGFDFDDVYNLDALNDDSQNDEEYRARTNFTQNKDDSENTIDPTSKQVGVTECYMRIDADGTGIPTLHKFIMGGSKYKLLDFMPCDQQPFAVFECDPEPHTVWGRSIVGMLMDDQDASTSILRGVLDNVALVNTPRLSVVDSQCNLDDVLNNEVGAIIRTRQPNAISPIAIPFTAGNTLGALQYLDKVVDQKSGVAGTSVGLNPDVLQSTTKSAVDHHISTAQGQVEVIARNLAEGGVTSLFRKVLHLVVKNSKKQDIMRLNGEFVPVDPRVWNTEMDLEISVGLGTGREEEKRMTLQQILGIQQQIYQQYGPSNGLVTLTQIRNTLADVLAGVGMRNAERYFNPMNPQVEQQMMMQAQQMAQNQPKPIDPAQAMMNAEQIKAQSKMQSDMAKMQLDNKKLEMEDDRKRDELDQELVIKAAELLSKHGISLDTNRIKEMQNAPRNNSNGQMQ
tara:strand:+ start:414 stop:2495 length:2082 start_codon:yes stop_codon:yes gene_type:complete